MVVDDSQMMRRLLIRTISLEGEFDFIEAESASEAVLKLAHRVPEIIFLDLMLGTERGFDLLSSLKKIPSVSDVPIVICSANSSEMFVEQAKRLGAAGFIPKPVNSQTLRSVVKALLEHEEGGEPAS